MLWEPAYFEGKGKESSIHLKTFLDDQIVDKEKLFFIIVLHIRNEVIEYHHFATCNEVGQGNQWLLKTPKANKWKTDSTWTHRS